MILGLCDRFKIVPSQARAEGASILRLMKIQKLGNREEVSGDGEPY